MSTTTVENTAKNLNELSWNVAINVKDAENIETYQEDLQYAEQLIMNSRLNNRGSISAILEQLARLI